MASIRHRLSLLATGTAALLTLAAACDAGTERDRDDTAAANVLESRTEVATMVEQTLNTLEDEMSLDGVEGWAVFSGDALSAEVEAGTGMAEDRTGESWFMRVSGSDCVAEGSRQLLVFRDADLFQRFRKGEVQGDELARAGAGDLTGAVGAFRVRVGEPLVMERRDIGACRFALHTRLQRALVAEPSETQGMIEEDEVYVDDN